MTRMDNIGAILKKRIKEMGFTQEEFADKCGISLSSLKKYMSEKVIYNIEILQIFSKELDCSYEYLLGESITPIRENAILCEELGLSNNAIEAIKKIKNNNDIIKKEESFYVLNSIIENDELLYAIIAFVTGNKYIYDAFNEINKEIYKGVKKSDPEFESPLVNTETMLIMDIMHQIESMRLTLPDNIKRNVINQVNTVSQKLKAKKP